MTRHFTSYSLGSITLYNMIMPTQKPLNLSTSKPNGPVCIILGTLLIFLLGQFVSILRAQQHIGEDLWDMPQY